MLEITPWADNFIIVLQPGDPVPFEHTPKTPFCPDPDCPCHWDDQESLAQVVEWYMDGWITPSHALDIIAGRKPYAK
jgi:hypothetical protein